MRRHRPLEHMCSLAGQLSSADCPACYLFAASRLLLSRISTSAWAMILDRGPGSLRPCGGATSSAVYSTVLVKAASSCTLLPLGWAALRWSPKRCRYFLVQMGLFISRRRSMGGYLIISSPVGCVPSDQALLHMLCQSCSPKYS